MTRALTREIRARLLDAYDGSHASMLTLASELRVEPWQVGAWVNALTLNPLTFPHREVAAARDRLARSLTVAEPPQRVKRAESALTSASVVTPVMSAPTRVRSTDAAVRHTDAMSAHALTSETTATTDDDAHCEQCGATFVRYRMGRGFAHLCRACFGERSRAARTNAHTVTALAVVATLDASVETSVDTTLDATLSAQLVALLRALPSAQRWDALTRKRWVNAFVATLDWVYETTEPSDRTSA